jgi:hypothetical protein
MPVYHSRRRELGNHLNTVTLLTGREGKFTSLNHAKPHFCTWYYSASLAQPHHNFEFCGKGKIFDCVASLAMVIWRHRAREV